jgi:D-threo-aldose 1-dehydrogenase
MNSDVLQQPALSPVQRRRLGRTDVWLPALGLGGAGLGNLYRPIEDDTAILTIRWALNEGIDYLDTAPHYGFGLSEKRIGEALSRLDRRSVTLSTKVGRVLSATKNVDASRARHGFYVSEPFEPTFDYSYDGVMRSFDSSLKRLRTETVDILLCHDIGELTHGADHVQRMSEFLNGGYLAMQALRTEGRVRALGIGVNEWEVCSALLPECEMDCVLLAGRYTLLEQSALTEVFELCAQRHVSLIIGGPFNSGILASRSNARDAHYNYETPPPQVVERVQRLERVCSAFGVPVGAAALQFPLAHPRVASVVAGCSSVEEVRQAKEWLAWPIPAELWYSLKDSDLLHPNAPVPA